MIAPKPKMEIELPFSPEDLRKGTLSQVFRIEEATRHYKQFMEAVGLPITNGTRETPCRVAKMFVEEYTSFQHGPPEVKLFENPQYDQYIVEKDISFTSLCEHHHLPFTGRVHIGYHPKEVVAGLSKLARVVHYFSSRPQIQERLTVEIAEYLWEKLSPQAVMVVCQASHTCMSARGVRDPDAVCVTSKVMEIEENFLDKAEMLRLMGF